MKIQIILSLITAIVETIAYGGIIFGWSSLYPIFLNEGYFSENCPKNVTSCKGQEEALSLVYSIATTSAPIISLFTGILLDKTGAWVTRTIFISLVSVGLLMTSFSRPGISSWMLFISFWCICVGGYGVSIVNIQACNLLPKFRALIASTINGACDSSTLVLLIARQVYNQNVSFSVIFNFLAAISIIFHIRTFTLTPKRPTPYILPKNYTYGFKELKCVARHKKKNLKKEVNQDTLSAKETPDTKSLKECLKEIYTWTHCLHFCIIHFCLLYILGIFNSWIKTKVPPTEIDRYTTVFGILICCAIFTNILVGWLIDYLRKRFSQKLPTDLASLKSIGVTHLICDAVVILMLSFMLIPSAKLQYFTFILIVFARSLIFGSLPAFISMCYPSQHFGVIFGITIAIAGSFLLLQYPVTLAVLRHLNNDFQLVFSVLLVICVLVTCHPIYVLTFVHRNSKDVSETQIKHLKPKFSTKNVLNE